MQTISFDFQQFALAYADSPLLPDFDLDLLGNNASLSSIEAPKVIPPPPSLDEDSAAPTSAIIAPVVVSSEEPTAQFEGTLDVPEPTVGDSMETDPLKDGETAREVN